MSRKRLATFGVGIAVLAMALVGMLTLHLSTSHAASSTSSNLQNLTPLGSGGFVAGATGLTGDSASDVTMPDQDRDQHTNSTPSATLPTTNPNPAGNSVIAGNGGQGFQGLDHYDTRTRDGGNAFSLEPPDQGLCVGHGYVVEPVNDVMTVFDTNGNRLVPATSLNTFFNLPVAINRATGARGPFLSDPKCLYDAGTDRFFLTVLEEPAGADAAHLTIRPANLIAVSTTNNPTGSWNLYSIDTTDDGQNGTPSDPGCPCFGDQPLIGADANGFYISTNEFPWFQGGFNGSQLYAISKTGLVKGSLPKVVHINVGNIPTPDQGGIWYSLQPATVPAGGAYAANAEYFLSALQFGPSDLDNRIAVWSLGNTSSLVSGNPQAVVLSNTVIGTETYGNPLYGVAQKSGSIPLGKSLHDKENSINPNDDRMNQVVYANGMLYGGLNSVMGAKGTRTGIAYFIVSPSDDSSYNVSASVAHQGYVSIANDNVIFPSIGVTPAGKAVMTFSVSGPDFFPSAGYTTLDPTTGAAGAIYLAGSGVGPADGFTGYSQYGGNTIERWGDYSAAVADENGNIWMAAENIAQTCSSQQYAADTTCGGTRTSLANWATFINEVTP